MDANVEKKLEELETQLAKANDAVSALEEKVAKAEAAAAAAEEAKEAAVKRFDVIGKLAAEDRAKFDGWTEKRQNEFLDASDETRKNMLETPIDPAMPEGVQKQFAELSKQLEDARAHNEKVAKQLAEETERRTAAEFSKRAEAEFGNLPGDPVEKGRALAAIETIRKTDAATADVLTKALTAGNEALASKMQPSGSDRTPDNQSSWDKIETLAKALVEKTEGLTLQAATTRIINERPDLYTQYVRGN